MPRIVIDPMLAAAFPGRLSKRSRVSQNRAALQRTFKTIEDLRAELVAFARRYDETWLVARHGYETPARVREEQTMPRLVIDPMLAAALPLAA